MILLAVAHRHVGAAFAVDVRVQVVPAHQERPVAAGPLQQVADHVVHALRGDARAEAPRRRHRAAHLVDARIVQRHGVREAPPFVQHHQRMPIVGRVAGPRILHVAVGVAALRLRAAHASVHPLLGGAQSLAALLARGVGFFHRDVRLRHHSRPAVGRHAFGRHGVVGRVQLAVLGEGHGLPAIDAEAPVDERHPRGTAPLQSGPFRHVARRLHRIGLGSHRRCHSGLGDHRRRHSRLLFSLRGTARAGTANPEEPQDEGPPQATHVP